MKPRAAARRRGQPLVALTLLMVSWVGARAAMWEAPTITGGKPAAKPQRLAPVTAAQQSAPAEPSAGAVGTGAPTPAQLPPAVDHRAPPLKTEPPVAPPSIVTPAARGAVEPMLPRVAANHELLLQAATSLPIEPVEAALDQPQRPVPTIVTRDPKDPVRWSADGWLLLRPGGNGFNAPGAGLPGVVVPVGFYGGSQAGLVLRYRLAPNSPLRPTIYLRASSGIERPRGEELAAGFSLRPVGKVPVSVMAEARATRTLSGTIVRPAVAVVSEFPPLPLPLGTRGEAYVQAGYVGGRDATAFIDGQARVDRQLAQVGSFRLRAGGGVWGGAQRGAARLDVGPTASLSVPVGPVGSRVSADYRFRVMGEAAPGSGPVLTLSAGF